MRGRPARRPPARSYRTTAIEGGAGGWGGREGSSGRPRQKADTPGRGTPERSAGSHRRGWARGGAAVRGGASTGFSEGEESGT